MKRTLEASLPVLALAAVFAAACSPTAASPTQRIETSSQRTPTIHRSVVLVAIDGVRWQDVFEGVDGRLASLHYVPESERVSAEALVPNITRLMGEGAALGAPSMGPPITASGPDFLSMPGYSEMLSGRRDTGCTDNACGRIGSSTVADDVAAAGIGRAVVVTSWPDIERAAASAPENADMSVGRHGGPGRDTFERDPATRDLVEAGEHAGPDPGYDDFRSDAQTAELALAAYDAKRPAFLFVGLGETDEFAHHEDYRGYLDALRRADRAVGRLADAVLRPKDGRPPGTLLVTTDHGRSDAFAPHGGHNPESARVWLVAAGSGIVARGPASSPEPRHLANVAPTIRAILGVAQPPDTEGPLTELFASTSVRRSSLE